MHTHTFYGDYLKARFLGIRYLSMRALGFELVLTMIRLMTTSVYQHYVKNRRHQGQQ